MSTTAVLGIKTGFSQEVIPDSYLTQVGAEIENTTVQLSEFVTSGCFASTDFNMALVAGVLELDVSAGTAIVGAAGARKPVRISTVTRLTVAGHGLTASATNYIYLKRDGTWTANTTGVAPANSELVGTAVASGTTFTSANSNPTGRVNLLRLSMLQAGVAAAPVLTAGAEAADARVVTIQVKDLVGNNLAERRLLRVLIADTQHGAEAASAPSGGVTVGVGTLRQTVTAGKQLLILSDATGQVQITLTEATVKTFWVHAELAGREGSVQVAFA